MTPGAPAIIHSSDNPGSWLRREKASSVGSERRVRPRMAAGHLRSHASIFEGIRGCSFSQSGPGWPEMASQETARWRRKIEKTGGVQEWLIWRARKARVRATVPWVRIPPPPPCALHFLRSGSIERTLSCPAVQVLREPNL